MNKVIDKGFRSCRFVSTIVKHPALPYRWPCFPDDDVWLGQTHLVSVKQKPWHSYQPFVTYFHIFLQLSSIPGFTELSFNEKLAAMVLFKRLSKLLSNDNILTPFLLLLNGPRVPSNERRCLNMPLRIRKNNVAYSDAERNLDDEAPFLDVATISRKILALKLKVVHFLHENRKNIRLPTGNLKVHGILYRLNLLKFCIELWKSQETKVERRDTTAEYTTTGLSISWLLLWNFLPYSPY